jgi:DNA-binding SARP family transcriptional activator
MRPRTVWRDLLAAGVLLAATPIVLLRLLPPLPALPSTSHDIARVLAKPLAATGLPWLISGAAWCLWATLLIAVLMAGWRRVRRQRWPRLRLPGPAQTMSAALLGTVAASSATPPLAAAIHSTLTTATDPLQHAATAPGVREAMVTARRPAATQALRPAGAAMPAAIPLQGVSTVDDRGFVLAASVTADDRPPTGQPLIYQVRRGDWLGGIAARFLGDFDRYPEIQELNPTLIKDPNLIQPAWRLVLPADAHDLGARRHATGQLAPPPPAAPDAAAPAPNPGLPGPPGPAPARPHGLPSTPSTAATSTPSTLLAPPATTRPGTTATATGRPAPSTTDTAEPRRTGPPAHTGRDHTRGVDLPGGWIGLPLAAALVTAAATVWLHRRHRYVPQPVGPDNLDDPDLRPLPPVVNRIRRAVRQQTPDLTDPASADEPAVDHTANRDHRPSPTRPGGLQLAGVRDRLPPTGLGLVGPGAESAVRALLVATLSADAQADPDARGEVVIPASTVTALLGADAGHVGQVPGLHVTGTLSEALNHLDELLIQRRRLVEDHDVAGVQEGPAADAPHPPMPPILLLAQTPPTQLRARLATTLHLGAPVQISAVLVGDWPPGATATVHADGRTTGAGTERLAVLDSLTTVQLLDVLRETHTAPAGSSPPEQKAHPGKPAAAPPHAQDPDRAPAAGTAPPDARAGTAGEAAQVAADAPPAHDAAGVDDEAASTPARNPAATGATHRLRLPVRIHLLGEPRILDRDGNPVPGLRQHARQLLVYLTVHRSGADLSTIMEAFWPNATVRRAEQRLSTEAGNLRRRIREAAGDKDKAIQPVVNTGGRYHLNPKLLDIDVWRLVDALRQAGATTDPDARIAALQRAVDTHTGTLAAGQDYDWIEQPREQLRRHGVRARISLAEMLSTRGDVRNTVELLRAAADLDPINEDLARQAMHALAETGDAAGIRARLQRLRTALHDIDEQPSSETVALASRLLHQIGGEDQGSAADPPE